jgi:ribosomal protein S7
MLNKEFKKYVSESDLEQFKTVFKREFTDENYLLFLRKFRGSMIYRGRSSLSYKLWDKIWKNLKIFMQKQKKYQRVDLAFKRAVFNLIPILSTANVKRGKKVQVIPVLLKQHRRIVLINKWLLSNQKNKSNVRGINIDLISQLIIDAIRKKGNAYSQKVENSKKSYNSRYILLRPKGKDSIVGFKDLQGYVLRKLKERYDSVDEEEKINIKTNLVQFISALRFLKFKSKSRFFKLKKKELRKLLRESWENTIHERIYTIMDWLDSSAGKKVILNKKLLVELLTKYYRVWRKKKEII